AFESNPMALVTEEMDESIDADPARREIAVEEMRSFLASFGHPLQRAVVGTLLKTGMRVGECCNLDLRDLHLDDRDVQAAYPATRRGALDGRPDSVFVPAAPERGVVYNGEERTASNKRQRDTVIPVDSELKRLLKAWLAIRPDTESSALFRSTAEWGTRTTPSMVRTFVTGHAREFGWHRPGGDASENVTPHYFRHFFTTHLRDRTGDRGIVKYLRGDVASDIIDAEFGPNRDPTRILTRCNRRVSVSSTTHKPHDAISNREIAASGDSGGLRPDSGPETSTNGGSGTPDGRFSLNPEGTNDGL
ncbi:hypothetical protein BRD11_04495, partial [Halobacteriales archaeon SW_12_69_24]